MRLRIMPLEERIVLDGAAAAQVADAAVDAAQDAASAAADAAAESSDSASADSAGTEPDSQFGDQSGGQTGEAGQDAGSGSQGADTDESEAAGDPVRVIAISSDIDQAQALADAALENVVTVVYDGESSAPDDILSQIESALDGRQAESIAFASHDLGAGTFHLSGDVNVSLGTVLNDSDVQEFWTELGGMLTDTGRIDLLSCGLAGTTEGEILLAQLETLAGHDVAASVDDTGNNVDGGDWLLEAGNVDAAETYFATSRLAQVAGVLGGESKVTGSDGSAGDGLGWTVAISGEYAVVGAELDDARGTDSGSVYVFKKSGDSWVQTAKLVPTDGQAGDQFGSSVAISGDYIVVGAQFDDDVAEDNGSVYIFHRSGENWVQETKLTSAKTGGWAYFGSSVAIDDDYLVVGAEYDSTAYNAETGKWSGFQGAAYVYQRSDSGWSLVKRLTAEDGGNKDLYGCSVDIHGNTIVVGAEDDDDKGTDSGSAYIYTLSTPFEGEESWDFTKKLTASDGAAGDGFGHDVAVHDGTIVIGALNDDDKGTDSGSAYVYTWAAAQDGSMWSQAAKLVDPSGKAGDRFGYSVDVGSTYMVVGAVFDDARGQNAGTAVVYQNYGSVVAPEWVYKSELAPRDGAAGDLFGMVAVSGDVVLGGACGDDDRGTGSGSAYFFDMSSGGGDVPQGESPIVDTDIPSQYAKVGMAYSYQFSIYTFNDNKGVDNLTYSASGLFGETLPSWLHFDAASRTFYGTPGDSDIGSVPVAVKAVDADGNSVNAYFSLSVQYNFSPMVENRIPDQVAAEDAPFSYILPADTFTDPDAGDSMTYTVMQSDGSALPSWLSWDPVQRTFSGMPSNSDVGSLGITVTASDQWGASVSDTFILTVSNTNDAPNAADSSVSGTEDIPYSFSANDFNFSDVDAGDSLGSIKIMGFSLPAGSSLTLNGQAVTAGQVISAASLGNLVFTPPADASGSGLASFTFQAGDTSGAYSAARTMTVNVAEANDAPTLTPSNPDMQPITEDAIDNTGQTVGSILAGDVSDPDSGASSPGMAITGLDSGNGTWQYSRNNGQTWVSVGSVSDTSALLLDNDDLIRFVPDGQNGDSPSMTYRAWDMSSGNAGSKVNVTGNGGTSAFSASADTANLTVTPVNDQPVNISLDNASVDENALNNTVVGTLSASDVDAGDTFTYTLVDDADGRFAINGDQLVVADGANLDFEGSGSHAVQVRVTDSGGATFLKELTVTLNNVNESPTGLELSHQSVVEKADNGAVVGDFSPQDPDAGDTFTYTLVEDAGGRFAINGSQLVVADGSLLDYAVAQSHAVIVRVTDSGGETYLKEFTIGVEDNTAPTDITLSGDVDENAENGTVVGDLAAVDNNHGDTFTYELLDTAGGRFALDGARVVVADGSLLDHESAASHDIRVRVTDGAGNTFEKIISVGVNDVNEAPTDIVVPTGTVSEDADTSSGIDLGVLSSSDPDVGDTKTYAVTGGANASLFEVVDGKLRIKAGAVLDHETADTLEVEVTVTDSGGLTLSGTVTVTVADVNEAPTAISVPAQSVSEDADTSSPIDLGLLSATDQDDGDSHTFAVTGGANASLFEIVNGRLRLRAGANLDHENAASLEVQVTAFDTGGRGYSQMLNIEVGDVNEAPTNVSLDNTSVAEDTDTSSAVDVGILSAEDQDSGDTHAYTVTGGADAALFQIVDGRLQLRAGVMLDHETTAALEVEVTARDADGLEFARMLTISVADVNEAPTVDNPVADQSATEDTGFSFTLPADTFSDQDAGDSLTLTATLADGSPLPSWLSFDPAAGTFSGTPANADVGVIRVRVAATDQDGLVGAMSFDLATANVNDAPEIGNVVQAQWATRDAAFSCQVPEGAFVDVDAGDSLAWSATLADGSALPAWLHFDAATRTFSGTPDDSVPDRLAIRLTVTDLSGATAFSDFDLNVQNAPEATGQIPAQSASEDAGFAYQVPEDMFTDADAGDTLTLSATLADGSRLPGWLVFDGATRTFSGTPSDADAGSLRIAVVATDSHGASVTTHFDLNVAAVNDAPVFGGNAAGHSVDAGSEFFFAVPGELFSDPDGDALRWAATLANGSPLPAWLTFDPATRTFSGLAMNTHQGVLDVMLTVFDAEGLSASTMFSLTVVPTDSGLEATAGDDAPVHIPGNAIPGHGHAASSLGSAGSRPAGPASLAGGELLPGNDESADFSAWDAPFGSEGAYEAGADDSSGYHLYGSPLAGDSGFRQGLGGEGDFADRFMASEDSARTRLAEAYDRTMGVFDESYVSFLTRLERLNVQGMTPVQLDKVLKGLEQMELVRARIESRLASDRAGLPEGGYDQRLAKLSAVRERIESLKARVVRGQAESGPAPEGGVVPANAPRPDAPSELKRADAEPPELKAAG